MDTLWCGEVEESGKIRFGEQIRKVLRRGIGRKYDEIDLRDREVRERECGK